VSKRTRANIKNIYVVRRELEPPAAALARQGLTTEQLAKFTSLAESMQTAGEARNFPELLKTDLAFHRLIWNLCGNKAIERALNAVCRPIFALNLINSSSGDPYDQAKDVGRASRVVGRFERRRFGKSPRSFRKYSGRFLLPGYRELASSGG